MGTEFLLQVEKVLENGCRQCEYTVHLKMVKMVDAAMCILPVFFKNF